MEVVIINQQNILFSNLLSQWGELPYGELAVLVSVLKATAAIHQSHHWASLGDDFYGDHLLFERVYDKLAHEIDAVAEKSVGLGGVTLINPIITSNQVATLIANYGPAQTIPRDSELAMRSLSYEEQLIQCVEYVLESLEYKHMLTKGVDNLLAGIIDNHEGSIYLLRQRCTSPSLG